MLLFYEKWIIGLKFQYKFAVSYCVVSSCMFLNSCFLILCRFLDTSKQAIGMLFIHFANVYLSDLTEEDPCSLWVLHFWTIDEYEGCCCWVCCTWRLMQFSCKKSGTFKDLWSLVNLGSKICSVTGSQDLGKWFGFLVVFVVVGCLLALGFFSGLCMDALDWGSTVASPPPVS